MRSSLNSDDDDSDSDDDDNDNDTDDDDDCCFDAVQTAATTALVVAPEKYIVSIRFIIT